MRGQVFSTLHQEVGFAPNGCKATMRYTVHYAEQMLGGVG